MLPSCTMSGIFLNHRKFDSNAKKSLLDLQSKIWIYSSTDNGYLSCYDASVVHEFKYRIKLFEQKIPHIFRK